MQSTRDVEVLSSQECWLRLGRGGIGRVAVTVGALPAIFPVHYATIDNDILFRSQPGTKLTAAVRRSIVAFEVDGTGSLGDVGWSVMVVGPAHLVTDPEEILRVKAVPLVSWAPGGGDVFVRIEGRLVSGRELRHVFEGDATDWSPLFPSPAIGGLVEKDQRPYGLWPEGPSPGSSGSGRSVP